MKDKEKKNHESKEESDILKESYLINWWKITNNK